MATINGTPVNFSFQSAAGVTLTKSDDGITFTGLSGILLQRASYKKNSTRALVKSGAGDRVTSSHADFFTSATLNWKISGSNLAGAITNTTLVAPGSFVRITVCDTMPEIAHTTNKWEVISGEVTGVNEDVKEISLEIEYSPDIQSRAT